MSEIKMSDVFELGLPLSFDDGRVTQADKGSYYSSVSHNSIERDDYMNAIVIAVNSHDKLTEQNKLLREFIKSLNLSGTDDIRRTILLEDMK